MGVAVATLAIGIAGMSTILIHLATQNVVTTGAIAFGATNVAIVAIVAVANFKRR